MEIVLEDIEDISGIHENGNPEKLKNKIDFSNIDNLKKADELPIINITDINGDSCSENGQFIAKGKIVEEKNNKLLNKYNNIEISFSLPESSGLCQININNNKEIIMTCENTEKFDVSQILIEKNVVQDKEGNYLFIINSYSNLEVFGCDVSYDSIITPEESEEPAESSIPGEPKESDEDDEEEDKKYFKRSDKGGLSAGTIAIIIVSVVVVVIVVIILIILGKKGKLFNKREKSNYKENENTNEIFDIYA